jgi:hypothetical protein
MGKFPKDKVREAIAYLVCTFVLWLQLDDLNGSEFSGGRLTGPLLKMADLGFLLFLLALILAFFFRRTAATIAIAAALLCLPFYLFFLVPGPYLWIFKGEYSDPLYRPFHWDNRAVIGVFSLLLVAILSLRSYSKVKVDV